MSLRLVSEETCREKIAAIYARVSSDKQKEEGTIDSQTEALRKYAEAHQYTVPPEWILEDEGYSGSLLIRPGLERLRDLAAEGQIEAILIYSPDRLSRRYAYQVLLMEEFKRQGVEVIFVQSPPAQTAEDQLLLQFQGMIAEYERAQIAERSRRGKRHRARCGEVSVLSGAPYGYRYSKKSEGCAAFYEVLEQEAAVVRQIYGRYVEDSLSIGQIVRKLNAEGIPTRSGRAPWERTTVWDILRNPAYMGKACFGKTERAERRKITRALRNRKGYSPRNSCSRERPRQEWIEIPIPPIIGEDVFFQAQERLQRNKVFAARHTKEPTLLQGLLVCSRCGYAYYRTSTRTSSRKLYYYRCLGSDVYRHRKGPLCTNRPVRQDYLDGLVWQHVVKVLESPELIHREIDRRMRDIQESHPARIRKESLEKERVRLQKNINRLMDAYQEGLLSLEELRQRLPVLRKKELITQADIQMLEASSMDQERYLRLAENLEGFLARLRRSAESLSVPDRQKVLRLVVKEILVDSDTLTVKHCIPVKEDGDLPQVPSYLLRKGSAIALTGQHLPG
jgi:site-specific DNA recombinase